MSSPILRSPWVGLVEVVFIHLLVLAVSGCSDAVIREGD